LTGAEGKQDGGVLAPGWQFGYQYDERGNPLRREHSGFVRSNSFNNLNQQANSVWSGGGVVLGLVNTTNASVTVNGTSASTWSLENLSVFGATNLTVQVGSNEYLAVLSDIFGRADTNQLAVTIQDQSFGYDLNGNLTNDGVRVYLWDEQNRLIQVRNLQTSEVLVQNRYDGLSRRRERVQLEGGAMVTNRYVYDGWLVVAVLDGENDVIEQYVHGVDLSGTREGAGGIGGILADFRPPTSDLHFYHYDGNGNVSSVTDSNSAITARYEYDPFGRVLLADGGDFTPRYQFSSKEYDQATGLNYYGYRFYNPELRRWINRDPIEERGGMNVYGFVGNNPILFFDPTGLLKGSVGGGFYWGFGASAKIDWDIQKEDCCDESGNLVPDGYMKMEIEVSGHVGMGVGGSFHAFGADLSLQYTAFGIQVGGKAGFESPKCGELPESACFSVFATLNVDNELKGGIVLVDVRLATTVKGGVELETCFTSFGPISGNMTLYATYSIKVGAEISSFGNVLWDKWAVDEANRKQLWATSF